MALLFRSPGRLRGKDVDLFGLVKIVVGDDGAGHSHAE